MKAAELRQSILQAAVQGKLVPQDPSDEPAFKLLERINSEKNAIAREKTPKSTKLMAAAEEGPYLYDLPIGWTWCSLGDIAIGVDYGTSTKTYTTPLDLPILRMNNIKNGRIVFDNIKYSKKTDVNIPFLLLNPGDILFNRTNSFELVGKSAVFTEMGAEYSFASYLIRVRLYRANPFYTNIYLNSDHCRKTQIEPNATQQNGQANFNGSKLKSILIPLPPLAEQQRIVIKVNELMTLCDELETSEKQLNKLEASFVESLPKSILQAAIQGKLSPQNIHDEPASELLKRIQQEKVRLIKEGKIKREKPLLPITEDEMPYDPPDGWCWCRLGDVCDLYTGNSINATEKSKQYTGLDSGRCYIGTKDIDFNHNIDYENGIKIPSEIDSFREAPEGAVLLCIEGGSAGRKIGITNRAICFGNKLCCFISICLKNKYLYYYLQSPVLIDFFKHGMTGIIGGVSVNSLKHLPIVIPPLNEQQRIVTKLDKLIALCDELKATKDLPITFDSLPKPFEFRPESHADEPEYRLAARGNISQAPSASLKQVLDDLFRDDEDE